MSNAEPISDEDLAEQIADIADLEVLDRRPARRYFEACTAAAFRWFADIAVDVAVVEVGLLGRWDATNVADAQVAVVTNIGHGPQRVRRADARPTSPGRSRGSSSPARRRSSARPTPISSPFFSEPPAARLLRGVDFETAGNRSPSAAGSSTSARRRRSTPTCSCRCTAPTRATTRRSR